MAVFIDGAQIMEAVMGGLKEFLDGLGRALAAHASGRGAVPPRTAFTVGGDWWGVMPGYVGGGVAVKVVGVHPGNAGEGLPTVTGAVAYFDVRGRLLAVMDGEAITGVRTAGATAISAMVAGAPASTIAVVGTGVEARYHLMLLTAAFKPRRVLVAGRDPGKAARLAGEFGGEAVGLVDAAGADLIVLATSSASPLLNSVPRGRRHVASIGAPRPVVELGRGLIEEAGCVFVDTRNAVNEAGEDLSGVELVELGEALLGRKCPAGELTVYKGVGFAALDAGAADFVASKLLPKA